jgi:hypothetical protein
MSILFNFQKRILMKQIERAKIIRAKKEKLLKEQNELDKIKKMLQETKKLRLTPSQEKLLKEKKERKQKNIAKAKNILKISLKGLDKFSAGVERSLNEFAGEPKKRKRN